MRDELLKLLAIPIAFLYGMGIWIRNFLYKYGLLKSFKFDIPTICIGNLSVGGSGKTPHVEFLARYLSQYIEVGTLSRGYGRKTKGFLVVQPNHSAQDVGDEPLLYKRKYPHLGVVVGEDRAFAIPRILMEYPQIKTILLDDAYQHLSLTAGLNILLTEFRYPFTKDHLLPYGRLREWRSGYKRADIIIVTKCPDEVTAEEKETFIADIQPLAKQKVFFSYYGYGTPYYLFNSQQRFQFNQQIDVLLVCGIAKPEYLVEYLKTQNSTVSVLEFEDHHFFKKSDVALIKDAFDELESSAKVIITTEKDGVRLDMHREYLVEHGLPLFILPIEVKFHFEEEEEFLDTIKEYLLSVKI